MVRLEGDGNLFDSATCLSLEIGGVVYVNLPCEQTNICRNAGVGIFHDLEKILDCCAIVCFWIVGHLFGRVLIGVVCGFYCYLVVFIWLVSA